LCFETTYPNFSEVRMFEFSIRSPSRYPTPILGAAESDHPSEGRRDFLTFLNEVGKEGWHPSAYQSPLICNAGEILLEREIPAK